MLASTTTSTSTSTSSSSSSPASTSLRDAFLLEPGYHYLNHGSFGACPKPVFAVYQDWQLRLERHPGRYMADIAGLLAESRAALAAYLNVPTDDLVYFPNPTSALNMAIRSLAGDTASRYRLRPGDEILTTDHEYGSLDKTWHYVCRLTGALYVPVHIPLPVTTQADFVERFLAGVTPATRVIYLSHLTSPTGLTFPVAEICRRARQAGLLTIVDGAHAPGQIPLDLIAIGADIYSGACHKWLCAPKGASFLYARPAVQGWLEPLVISWAWQDALPGQAQFVEPNMAQGTRDDAAYLAVPAAIEFQAGHDWPAVRAGCHRLLRETLRRVNELTGLDPVCPDESDWYAQLATARLPDVDPVELRRRLYDEYCVEVPVHKWHDTPLIRISIQAYNTQEDTDALIEGLRHLLPELQ
jgi:isopenicillin-N epimerase